MNDRFKYIDDLSILEILSISGAMTEFDCWQTVPSYLGINHRYPPPESCATQGNIDQISTWTDDNLMQINAAKTNYMNK